MTTQVRDVDKVTIPSDINKGRLETPGSNRSSDSSKRTRPSLLASVGKIFSRSKKKSMPRRATTPSTEKKEEGNEATVALTPIEIKYRNVFESSSD